MQGMWIDFERNTVSEKWAPVGLPLNPSTTPAGSVVESDEEQEEGAEANETAT